MCNSILAVFLINKKSLLSAPFTSTKHHSNDVFFSRRRTLDEAESMVRLSVTGWWQYDERTCNELENAYKGGQRSCELLIAGTLYVANFDGMVQLQKNDRSRWRRIKRDLSTVPKKGVAGLRIDVVLPPAPSNEAPAETVGETTSGDESSSLFLSENGPSTSFSTYRVQQEDSDTSESEESEEDEDDVEDVDQEVDEEGYKGDSSDTDSDTEWKVHKFYSILDGIFPTCDILGT